MLPAKLNLLGVLVSRVDYDTAVEEVIAAAKGRKSFGVTALAVHGLMEAHRDSQFAQKLNRLHLVTPDGQPVRWAMNLLGARELKERVYGPTLMLKVCERAAKEQLPIFLYGSKQSVLTSLRRNLLRWYPNLVITGTQADRFREATAAEDQKDIDSIEASGARIVFVGRGCPLQEKWVADHIEKIAAVMIAVGAAFDFHAGTLRQAPKSMQDWGLEWLFRLALEPKRLWKRYLIYNSLFLFSLTLQFMRVKRYE